MVRRSRRKHAATDGLTLVLDSGAIIGLSRGDRRARIRLDAAKRNRAEVVIPVVVLAETTRGNGPRDAPVNLVLAQAGVVGILEESDARLAGELLGRADSNSTIDALVAAEAIRRAPSMVLTSDPDDLNELLADYPAVSVQAI